MTNGLLTSQAGDLLAEHANLEGKLLDAGDRSMCRGIDGRNEVWEEVGWGKIDESTS